MRKSSSNLGYIKKVFPNKVNDALYIVRKMSS